MLTGDSRPATPEEAVRQHFLRYMLSIGYRPADLAVEFPARFGCKPKRLDVCAFRRGAPRDQSGVALIVEVKRRGVSQAVFDGAVEQCRSYVSACTNAMYGVTYDGDRMLVLRKGYYRNGAVRSDWQFVETRMPGPEVLEEQQAATMRVAPRVLANPGPVPINPGGYIPMYAPGDIPPGPSINWDDFLRREGDAETSVGATLAVFAVLGGAMLIVVVGFIILIATN